MKRKLTEAQKRAMIARKTSERKQTSKPKKKPTSKPKKKAETNVGKVYRGRTKYIDPETKHERDYVVVRDNGKNVTVSKLKSIKKFDENGKNADRALVEINHARYGLPKRTGVDFQRFDNNRMSGKRLTLEDKDVFPEDKERFALGSRDKHEVLKHTGRTDKRKKRGK